MNDVVPMGRSTGADETAAEPRSTKRGLRQIDADVMTVRRILFDLQIERRRFKTARRVGIVRDFDAGKRRDVIAKKWGVDIAFVTHVLSGVGRSERRRDRQRKLRAA